MILLFLLLLSGLQITSYKWLEHRKKERWKSRLLLLIVLGNSLLFPQLFIPRNIDCGMPVLGIYMAFWIFGNTTTLLVHLSYHFINKISLKKY